MGQCLYTPTRSSLLVNPTIYLRATTNPSTVVLREDEDFKQILRKSLFQTSKNENFLVSN